MRRFLILCLLALSACAAPEMSCTDPLGCVFVRANQPLLLGALLDVSGPAAALSNEVAQGMTLALAQRDNRLLEHPLRVQLFDARCERAAGETAAREIARTEQIVAVLGTVCGESAAGALPPLTEAGMLLLSPANSAPQLTHTAVFPPPYFRAIPHSLRQAELMARFATEVLQAETAVIFYNETPYSEGLRQTFASTFTQLGGSVPFQTRFSPGSSLDVMLQVAVLNEPDVIYLPLYEIEATTLINAALSLPRLQETAFLGTDSLLLPSFPAGLGAAPEGGLYVSGYAVRSQEYAQFLAAWQQAYATVPETPYAAFAYDATDLLLNAIAAAAQRDSGGALLIGRAALRQALAETRDWPGLSGSLTCAPSGECASGSALAVFRLTDIDQPASAWPPPPYWPQGVDGG